MSRCSRRCCSIWSRAAPATATLSARARPGLRRRARGRARLGAVARRGGADRRCRRRATSPTFFDWFAGTERTVTLYSQGVNQSSAGTDKVNAIINCHLATGRIGRPGMGPFSLTGQPNAMGGREVGGLANQLAAHMGFANPADIDRVRRFWNAPHMATRPGLKAVELFDAMLRRQGQGAVGARHQPGRQHAARRRGCARRWPPARSSSSAIAGRPTRRALPMSCCRPPAGARRTARSRTRSACISRQRAFRAPPGEARPDWWMLTEVARRMGWEGAFPYRRPADIFREHAALSGFENDGGTPGLRHRRAGRAERRRIRPRSPPRAAGRCRAAAPTDGRIGTPLRRRRAVSDRGRPRPLRADPVPPARRRRRQAPAAAAEYRPHPRPVAHDDAHRPAATPDGAPARAAARHPSGGRGAARSRRGRSRPHRERAWRDGIAGPPFGRAAPRRSLRARCTGPTRSRRRGRSEGWCRPRPTRFPASPS